jgi:plasmid stabilization system protein ParE
MKTYKVQIDPDALLDIQEIRDWYNDRQVGLGQRFQKITVDQINTLHRNPQTYAIRYEEIRCMIVVKFPNMVHFYINNKTGVVEVLAVISTDRSPKIWKEKTGQHL